MQKGIKNIFFIAECVLCAVIFCCPDVVKAEEIEGGINEYNDFVVSPTLALRCGLSPEKHEIEDDCVRRLA